MVMPIKDLCKVMFYIEQKAMECVSLPGTDVEREVFADVYNQAIREAGCYSVEYMEEKYVPNAIEAIKNYKLPEYLKEKIEQTMEKLNENQGSKS